MNNFLGILSSLYMATVPVYHITGVKSGYVHENNSVKITCTICQLIQNTGSKLKL
jgi:hypothetical protein